MEDVITFATILLVATTVNVTVDMAFIVIAEIVQVNSKYTYIHNEP